MSIFRLQQFAINQSRSGMKICSDSLLFGALIPLADSKRILDIGAGTGILSLMQAQKINALDQSLLKHSIVDIITAVELTQEAAEEARENFERSPWSKQLRLVEQDIQSFAGGHTLNQQPDYDLIICNPPFFAQQSKTSVNNPLRHLARHTDALSFYDLMTSIDTLLSPAGRAFLLLPLIALDDVCAQANAQGFRLVSQTDIAETEKHDPKVAVLEFERGRNQNNTSPNDIEPLIKRLNKFQQYNVHSDAVKKLLQPFLLRYR